MTEQKKRKQHYVWEHYLTAWATTNGRVWCQMEGRRFQVATDNVAHERDFYRLKELTEDDLQRVQQLAIAPTVPQLRELAKGWVDLFRAPFELQRAYLEAGRKDPEIEKQLDIAINNLEENVHAKIEGESIKLLAALKQGDHSAIEDEEQLLTLALFVATQYLRTPGIMRATIDATSDTAFNIEAAWGLLRTIFSTNIGWAIFSKRSTMRTTFADAPPGHEFVTGDQPLINTHAAGLAPGEAPTKLEFWYPLSPTKGLLLSCDNPSPGIVHRQFSADEAAKCNRMIVKASHRQVFAATEPTLLAACASATS
jgi:hypothetical protein